MKKFKCSVCQHEVAAEVAPEVCPVCKQAGKFVEQPVLAGSQTEANLWTAFAGESQARNKYTYFASKAKKEGFVQIAAIFEEKKLKFLKIFSKWGTSTSFCSFF